MSLNNILPLSFEPIGGLQLTGTVKSNGDYIPCDGREISEQEYPELYKRLNYLDYQNVTAASLGFSSNNSISEFFEIDKQVYFIHSSTNENNKKTSKGKLSFSIYRINNNEEKELIKTYSCSTISYNWNDVKEMWVYSQGCSIAKINNEWLFSIQIAYTNSSNSYTYYAPYFFVGNNVEALSYKGYFNNQQNSSTQGIKKIEYCNGWYYYWCYYYYSDYIRVKMNVSDKSPVNLPNITNYDFVNTSIGGWLLGSTNGIRGLYTFIYNNYYYIVVRNYNSTNIMKYSGTQHIFSKEAGYMDQYGSLALAKVNELLYIFQSYQYAESTTSRFVYDIFDLDIDSFIENTGRNDSSNPNASSIVMQDWQEYCMHVQYSYFDSVNNEQWMLIYSNLTKAYFLIKGTPFQIDEIYRLSTVLGWNYYNSFFKIKDSFYCGSNIIKNNRRLPFNLIYSIKAK